MELEVKQIGGTSLVLEGSDFSMRLVECPCVATDFFRGDTIPEEIKRMWI